MASEHMVLSYSRENCCMVFKTFMADSDFLKGLNEYIATRGY